MQKNKGFILAGNLDDIFLITILIKITCFTIGGISLHLNSINVVNIIA